MTADTDTVTVPDDLAGAFQAHWICGICYPQAQSDDLVIEGLTAVCGAKVLGVAANPDDMDCARCLELRAPHQYAHFEEAFS